MLKLQLTEPSRLSVVLQGAAKLLVGMATETLPFVFAVADESFVRVRILLTIDAPPSPVAVTEYDEAFGAGFSVARL